MYTDNNWQRKAAGWLCQRQIVGDAKSHLEGQCTNFHLQPLTWDSTKGGDRVGWRLLRGDWGWKFGERSERVANGIPVLSIPHTSTAILLRKTTPYEHSNSLKGYSGPTLAETLPWLCIA